MRKECLLVNRLGERITVGENQLAVGAALCLNQNEVCGSTLKGGDIGCIEHCACGNGNNNGVNGAVCAGFFVAILIGVSNGNGFVGNANRNVSCGHYEGVVGYVNLKTGGLVNYLNAGNRHANLVDSGNSNGFALLCICLINSCIAVGKYVIIALVLFTVELNRAGAGDQILKRVLCECLAGNILPDVAGGCGIGINGELEVCKVAVHPLCKSVGVGLCGGGISCVEIELNGELALGVADEEQAHVSYSDLAAIKAEPAPTVCLCITCRKLGKGLCGGHGLIVSGVGNGKRILKSTVYIVVYLVGTNGCNVLNGYSSVRHYVAAGVLNTVKERLCILNAVYCSICCKGCVEYVALCIPAGCNAGSDCNRTCGQVCKLIGCKALNNVCILNGETVLVNNGNGGEVRSVEGNGLIGCGNAVINVQFILVNVYKGLNVAFVLCCEGQNDFNCCAILEVAKINCNGIKAKGEVVSNCAGLCCVVSYCGSIGETCVDCAESSCLVSEESYHLVVQSNLLSICNNRGEYKCAVELAKELSVHGEVQSVNALCCHECIPLVGKNNGASIVGENDLKVNAIFKAVDLKCCILCVLIQGDVCVNGDVFFNGCIEDCIVPLVRVRIFKEGFLCGECRIERCSCRIEVCQIVLKQAAVKNCNSCAGIKLYAVENRNNGYGVVSNAVNVCQQNYVLLGHNGYVFAGCFIQPAVEALNGGVINHLFDADACGKQGGENNGTVLVLELCLVEVVHLNGYVKAGSDIAALTDICHEEVLNCAHRLFIQRGTSCNSADHSIKSVIENCLCVEGDILIEYETGIATVEVHEAVVCDDLAVSGSQQTVGNLNSAGLNCIVNSATVFELVNNCGVEECKRILGSSCLLHKALHIEICANTLSQLIDHIVNGSIEVAVYLCGQTVGDLEAGYLFKLFNKLLKGGNGFECLNNVLNLKVIGKIVSGHLFDVHQQNLCITRCECLVVNLAKDCGINRFENSNDLFNGQALCKCDEIIGSCLVSCEDLILECVELGIAGVSHLFESHAQYGCKLGRNGNVNNQLAVYDTEITDLIDQGGELCGCSADVFNTTGENHAEIDLLGLFNVAIEVGDSKACIKHNTVIADVLQLVESGDKTFNCLEQFTCIEGEVFTVLFGNYNAVNCDSGYVLLDSSNQIGQGFNVVAKVDHTNQRFENAGLVDQLCGLFNVDLVDDRLDANGLQHTLYIKDSGKLAVFKNIDSDRFNVKALDECGNVGNVNVDQLFVATGSIHCLFNTDRLNCCGIVGLAVYLVQAVNDIIGGDNFVIDSGLDLSLDNRDIRHIVVSVTCSAQSLNRDDVVSDQFLDLDNVVVKKLFNVQNAFGNKCCKVGEQRYESAFAEQERLNVEYGSVQEIIVQIGKNIVCEHSCNVKG